MKLIGNKNLKGMNFLDLTGLKDGKKYSGWCVRKSVASRRKPAGSPKKI